MTKETRFLLALDEYETRKGIYDWAYRRMINNAPCDEAGEVDAQYILETNMWHTEKTNELQRELWEKIQGKEA